MAGTEVPLSGGNMNSGVVRVGDTVRRSAGFWTPAVHALLGHLHGVGFDGAPRPLGVDGGGREVLSFIAGESPWAGRFHLMDWDRQLRRVASFQGPASARGSLGRPSTRSPMMFRCTWEVPA